MPVPDSTTQLDLIASHFGKRLRYWRRHRGHTQTELARELDIDGSYISKLESAHRRPGSDIARQCDELLDTGGELTELMNLISAEESPPAGPSPTTTVIPGPPPAATGHIALPPAITAGAAASLARLAESFAEVEASMGGQHIGQSVEQQAQAAVAMHTGSAVSGDLLRIAARFARLAGAIRADSLDDAGALYWNDCAHRWALDGDERGLAAEMCARQAFVQAGRSNTSVAIALGVRAEQLAPTAAAAVWGLLAQARGLAAANDSAGTAEKLRSLAPILTGMDGPLMSPPVIHSDTFLWRSHVGHCHLILAEHDRDPETNGPHALDHLNAALSAASVHHTRDLALTRLSLARAHLSIGDTDAAATEVAEATSLARACASPRLSASLAHTYAHIATAETRTPGRNHPPRVG